MELNDYQEKAMSTCMASCENFSYMFINLVGEVGELASKVAKAIRKEQMYVGGNRHHHSDLMHVMPFCDEDCEMREEMKKEADDILWQLAGLCEVMGWDLEDVAMGNLDKLASRQQRGVIDGEGDNR